jgi:hypothetical protein
MYDDNDNSADGTQDLSKRASYEEQWRRAQTLQELGELTARWLEGDLKYNPFDSDEPYQETQHLIPTLAEFNRKGFVTTFSQPGIPLVEGSGQRAAVDGFCEETVALRLAALTLFTDLLVLALPPGVDRGCQIPVTVDEYHPFTWVGVPPWQEVWSEDGGYTDVYSDEAMQAIRAAWYVLIIDPCWGRDDLLWEHVKSVLNSPETLSSFSAEPSPQHGLDVGFVC